MNLNVARCQRTGFCKVALGKLKQALDHQALEFGHSAYEIVVAHVFERVSVRLCVFGPAFCDAEQSFKLLDCAKSEGDAPPCTVTPGDNPAPLPRV